MTTIAIENEAINKSKEIIRKAIAKWMLVCKKEMGDDYYYNVSKNVYKKCYPLRYRWPFISLSLDIIKDSNRFYIACDILKNYSSLVERFNHIVDILSNDELLYIGW
jgi:hypothetical protein